MGTELERRIYSSWAFTENEREKAKINKSIYKELMSKYICVFGLYKRFDCLDISEDKESFINYLIENKDENKEQLLCFKEFLNFLKDLRKDMKRKGLL